MIKLSTKGNFKKLTKFLNRLNPKYIYRQLDKYGKMGVDALREATPKRTGKTSESWYYEIQVGDESATITWNNSNENQGVPIALMIQYGHGMPHGGYVSGINYINPALRSVFELIQKNIWNEFSL